MLKNYVDLHSNKLRLKLIPIDDICRGIRNRSCRVLQVSGTDGNHEAFRLRRYILKDTSPALSQGIHASQMRNDRR